MYRKLFLFTFVVCLMLISAFIVLWIRSYHVADQISYAASRDRRYAAKTVRGRLLLYTKAGKVGIDDDNIIRRYKAGSIRHHSDAAPKRLTASSSFWAQLGFKYRRYPTLRTIIHFVSVPIWFVLMLLAIVPMTLFALGWRHWRHQRHRNRGECCTCGYDLRASTDHCPECGAPIQSSFLMGIVLS